MCLLGSATDRTYGIASSGFGVLSDGRHIEQFSSRATQTLGSVGAMRGKIFIKERKTEKRTVFTHKLGHNKYYFISLASQ